MNDEVHSNNEVQALTMEGIKHEVLNAKPENIEVGLVFSLWCSFYSLFSGARELTSVVKCQTYSLENTLSDDNDEKFLNATIRPIFRPHFFFYIRNSLD